ncbi:MULTISPECIES: hypothetical protein [Pseudomonas]|nr:MULTISPECIES: hypothetical protein [Pseudomonas]MCJ7854609.1 hypothetical protein [Pseudomonas monteilii]MDT3750482.1 hypothetical protein [Pseudomonas kurunegalensis]QXM18715.1 hypothetical protein [Pseudomonas phage PARCL1pr]
MKIRQYRVRFADGRTSTVLDMEGEPPETLIPGLVAMFAAGYVLEVIPV